MKLPMLYKTTSTGAAQYWQIETQDNAIVTTWGQVDGAAQTTRDVIAQGKNLGKKNETTPVQQAQLEARARWEKKLKKDYAERLGETSDRIQGGVLPMLAHKFHEQGHKIVYPAFAQPKLDGHRCIAVVAGGKATLWSRTRKPILTTPHIVTDVVAWAQRVNRPDIVLDGEFYSHDYKGNFEKLTHYIRHAELNKDIVQYHVYDVATPDTPFVDRHAILDAFSMGGALRCVETIAVANEDELMLAFEKFREQGYEGAMVRNMEGLYANRRSADLQKIKDFDDGEFGVIGVEEGRGKLAGHAIFVCRHEGRPFNAKMKGKTSDLMRYWQNPELAIGRQLSVQYQGLTNKTRVPRFPVALRFRDDL